jgi:ribosomal protein S7
MNKKVIQLRKDFNSHLKLNDYENTLFFEAGKYIMRDGKLPIYNRLIKEVYKKYPEKKFMNLIEELKPSIKMKTIIRGRTRTRVPIEISNSKRKSIALLWLKDYIKKTKGTSLKNKVENILRSNNKILINKNNLHQEALRNRGQR